MTFDRSFPASDLIQLPRFDSSGAVALGDRLLAAADTAGSLPRSIQRARDALAGELVTMRDAAAARLLAAGAEDPVEVAAADCALDGCWTALHDWLRGFAQLPGAAPETIEANALLHELYPNGLDFILLPYELEWGQSEQRLARMTDGDLGDRIRALGGRVFITSLRTAHDTYGRVLGLARDAPKKGDRPPNLREALDGFAAALRVYALKVTAHVEVEEPETMALAKVLLAPLLTWRAAKDGG